LTIHATICHITRGEEVLLLKKSRGFGKGKWNAPGGKLEPEERPEAGAMREVEEETGLTPTSLRERGELMFYFGEKRKPDWIVHLFECREYEGTLQSGEEGRLQWFSPHEIPYDEMWEDDRHWLPHLLSGQSVNGYFWFDEDAENLLSFTMTSE
jgi:8-oxo-dGTP diphosphatase